jgi:hypothetical protein
VVALCCAQWEIYYPAFKAAVDAGVATVMCSYNRINDTWACENDRTINKDLKGSMGFEVRIALTSLPTLGVAHHRQCRDS